MFAKFLLFALVLVAVWVAFRVRSSPGAAPRRPTQIRPPPGPPAHAKWLPAGTARALAYGLVSVMVAGAGLYLFEGWEAARRPVTVRVINANTGEAVTYQANPKDITGRSLRTLDGRRVTLADVERMEVSEPGAR